MLSDRERWDARHAAALAAGGAGRLPVDWLLAHAALLEAQPPGPALDVACGLGRNALHLARLGREVVAVDVSAVAIEHLAATARAEGLPVHARLADLASGELPGGGYQVVVATYFLARPLFPAMAAALAPGGLLIVETFLSDPEATYGPRDPARVLRPGELRRAFAGLEVLDAREGRPDPASRPVAGLVARRPLE